MTAVKGVVGGSGAHRTAIRQFRTPSLPRVIVCTDTLKEGVDLHLFCDRVIHYGVAWTSGDLEQRVGRVDRYFSQIERRLRTEGSPPDVRLDVKYPYILTSLEYGQVKRVIERQRKVERLLHSPVAVSQTEDKEIVVGRSVTREPSGKISTYGRTENHFPAKRRKLSILSKQRACNVERHYQRWYKKFLRSTSNIGWRAEETEISNIPVRLSRGLTECCLNWGYDTSLRRYIITLSFSSRYTAHSSLGGKYKRLIGREYREPQSFIRLLVPTPQEGTDEELISHVVDLLEGRYPLTSDRASEFWVPALKKFSISQLEWESKSKVNTLVSTQRNRKQKITIQVYQGGIHLTSLISPIQDLEPRSDWGEEPSSDDVREWAMLTSNGLTLGYVELDNTDNLIFGAHVLHGQLAEDAGEQLIGEVSSRADAWEASLTGVDRY